MVPAAMRRQPGGTYRWLSAWAQVTFEGEGPHRRAVRMVGSTRDVTESRTRELVDLVNQDPRRGEGCALAVDVAPCVGGRGD